MNNDQLNTALVAAEKAIRDLIELNRLQQNVIDQQDEAVGKMVETLTVMAKKLNKKAAWTPRDFYTKVFSTFN